MLLFFSAISATNAQNILCNFMFTNNFYTCQLSGITILDNENTNIVIGGVHQPGYSDSQVQLVAIVQSNVPFIITQAFTTFTSLNIMVLEGSGLLRIQSNAFLNAQNLWILIISNNPGLREIPANAFLGATSLIVIELFDNQVDTIHEMAVNGLNTLESLFLTRNPLTELPTNVLAPLTRLQQVSLSSNRLTRIEARLFANNSQIMFLNLSDNQINAIERTFLDSMPHLITLGLDGNICINSSWWIPGVDPNEILQALNSCFNNFDEVAGEVKRFIIHLRGELNISYENGTTIVTI